MRLLFLIIGIVIGIFIGANYPESASFISGNYAKYKQNAQEKFEENAKNYCRVNNCNESTI